MRKTLSVVVFCLLARLAFGFDCTGREDGFLATYFGAGYEIFPPHCLNGLVNYDTQPGVVSGTGTISSSVLTITGTGTDFVNELNVGFVIYVGGASAIVVAITDATTLTVNTAFYPALSGVAFTYVPPSFRHDNGGVPKLYIGDDGRIGQNSAYPTAFFHHEALAPDAVTSGDGRFPSPLEYMIGDPGGAVTAGTGTAGTGAGISKAAGAGGAAIAAGVPGPGGTTDEIAGPGGAVSSGSGGTEDLAVRRSSEAVLEGMLGRGIPAVVVDSFP